MAPFKLLVARGSQRRQRNKPGTAAFYDKSVLPQAFAKRRSRKDFKHCDLVFHTGQNPGTCSPRILHEFQRVRERGAAFIVFNPLRERGLERFTNPQRPIEMLTQSETSIATQYCLMKAGGDVPALMGVCKAVIALDDEAKASGRERVLDTDFIERHTSGFEDFAAYCRSASWESIEQGSGLSRAEIEKAAATYAKSKACLGIYGMGVTQQTMGRENVHMIANLLLLRGNIGKPGGNILPVRGHSNVQGQRTVGITEKPKLAPLDTLERQYGFKAPREEGLNIAGAANAIMRGELQALICLGGNLTRAIPDGPLLEKAWRKIPLTNAYNRRCHSRRRCGEARFGRALEYCRKYRYSLDLDATGVGPLGSPCLLRCPPYRLKAADWLPISVY